MKRSKPNISYDQVRLRLDMYLKELTLRSEGDINIPIFIKVKE